MIEACQTRETIVSRAPLDAEVRARAIVEKLAGVWHGTRGECLCPAHDDANPSLSVRLGDTAILFHCFAGCTTIEVLKALERKRLHDRGVLTVTANNPRRDMSALAIPPLEGEQASRRYARRRISPRPRLVAAVSQGTALQPGDRSRVGRRA